MALVVYPSDNYDSWISLTDSNTYMLKRLHSQTWVGTLDNDLNAALQMAFRTMEELNIDLDDLENGTTDQAAALLVPLKRAQCEQALYELENSESAREVAALGLDGLIDVKFSKGSGKVSRYSDRALAILRDYLTGFVTNRTR